VGAVVVDVVGGVVLNVVEVEDVVEVKEVVGEATVKPSFVFRAEPF